MRYSYIALTENDADGRDEVKTEAERTLLGLGMENRGSVGRLRLFASKDTPTLALPEGTIIIGDLYRPDGSEVTGGAVLPRFSKNAGIRHSLLANHWGEYILIQPSEENDWGATIMRDPSGGIPCAYSLQAGAGFVTSDISLAANLGLHEDKVDWDFISHCLVYPHLKTQRTGLRNVIELLPGCSLSFHGNRATTALEWSPWDFVAAPQRQNDPADAAAMIRGAVTTVVRAMAETDRELLVELSGGLDSSVVAACLKGTSARIMCCTVVTPLPGADERQYAIQMANYLGRELLHHELSFENADFSFPLPRHSLRPAVWALGNAIGTAMDALASRHTVSSYFSGSGGDTVFCYLKTAAPAADAFKTRGLAAGSRAIRDLAILHDCTIMKAARLTARKLLGAPKAPCKPDYSLVAKADAIPSPEYHPWFAAPPDALPGDRERIFDLASNQLFRDGTPRMERRRVRMPLLSQPVMEACLRVPSWMWISDGENRAVARSAFDDVLPRGILNRRSKGTFMNYTSAVYRRNKDTIRSFLLDGHLQSHGLLEADALNRYLDTTLPPRDRSFMRVFDLCMIENWIRNHS